VNWIQLAQARISLQVFYDEGVEHVVYIKVGNFFLSCVYCKLLREDHVPYVRGCIQKLADWPPEARTVNGIALCY